MKVSIVLPTYNQADMLPQAVQSVMAQTYGDWELIVVNDGSTDNTSQYLQTLPKTGQFKVVEHEKNRKLPAALNTGFKHATGGYFTWISSDSVCAPYMIQGLVRALDKYPDDAGLAYADFFIIDENDRILSRISNPDYCFRSLLIRNDGNAAFMYPKKVASEIGAYDENLNGAEDWDYWIRISEKHPFVYVPEALYYYRVHSRSMQQTIKQEVNESIAKMYDKTFERHGKQLRFEELFPYVDKHSDQAYFAMLNFGADLMTARIPQPANAAALLNGALQKAPDALVTWLDLGIAYAYMGRWHDTQACIREIRDRAGSDPILQYVDQLDAAYENRDIQQVLQIPVISFHSEQQKIVMEELKHKRQAAFTLD